MLSFISTFSKTFNWSFVYIIQTTIILTAKTHLHGLNKQVREGEGLGL